MVTAILATLVTVLGMAFLIAWAFGGVAVADILAKSFSTRCLVRIAQEPTGRLHGILTFAIVTAVFLVFGLMEVGVRRRQMERIGGEVAPRLVAAETAGKLRTFMLVRTLMSVVTGFAVWGFATWMGLDLAAE